MIEQIISSILLLLLLSIATEAVTEIIVAASITDPIRKWWKELTYNPNYPPKDTYTQRVKVFIDKLLSCGYCSSVWVAGLAAIWAPIIIQYIIPNWLIATFVIHRCANLLHVVYELIRKGRVKTQDLLIKVSIEENEDGIVGESEGESDSPIE